MANTEITNQLAGNLTAAEKELLSYLRQNGGDTEVLLLMRSKSNPAAKPSVFTLPSQPSPQFIQQVLSTQASNSRASLNQPVNIQSSADVILRGQSQ